MNLAHSLQGRQESLYMQGHNGNDSWIGALVGLLFVALMIWLVFYVVRALTKNNASTATTREPLDFAKERYAKGEITAKELTEIKKELK